MTQDILDLDANLKVAEGGERLVFIHPSDPSKLIKVIKHKNDRAPSKSLIKNGIKRLFPRARIRSIIKQYDEYNRLWLRPNYDPDFHLPISHLYGFVKTNYGLGGISERITGPDGENGRTLRYLAETGALSDKHLEQLNELIQRILSYGVCVSDVNPSNFVYGYRHIEGTSRQVGPEWVLVDGFGDRYAIPLRTWSKTARYKGAIKSLERKRNPTGLIWDSRACKYLRS